MSALQFLGVDGGGTATKAVLTDEAGEVLGRGEAGPSNPLGVGPEAALAAVIDAATQTGARFPIEAACIGLAGVGRESGRAIVLPPLEAAGIARKIGLATDAEVALAGAHAGEPGAIVSAGTGAIALAKSADGTVHRADGWGHLLGDEGSGYWIGRQALRTICRIDDWRAMGCFEDESTYGTGLRDAILAHLGVATLQDLVARVYDGPIAPAEVAGLARVVAKCAEDCDGEAAWILRMAGYELAHAARAVLRVAGLPKGPLCLMGGVFSIPDRFVREPFCEHLKVRERGIVLRPPLMSPAEGAALLARRLADGGSHPDG